VPPLSNRANGSSLSLVLIEPPAHVRGPVPELSIRAPGSSLSLVLIEPPTHVRGPVPGLSIRAPGSSLSLVLIEPPAHVRGPVPGLSIRAPWQLAIARAHREASARPRPSARALNSRPWQLAAARAHQAASARPRGLHPWQFAARGRAGRAAFLRSARAGPSAKARWRNVKVFSQVFFKKLVGFGVKPQDLTGVRGVLVPGGHRSGPTEAAAETSHRLPIHKKRGDARPQQGGTL